MRYFILTLFIGVLIVGKAQGLKINQKEYSKLTVWEPSDAQGYSTTLPAKISYRKYAPVPGDQGYVATCTGWAVAYGQLTTQQNLVMQISNPVQRTARAMDPHFIYSLIKNLDDKWCQEGTWIGDAMSVLSNFGCKPRFQDPILECNATQSYSDYTLEIASPYKIDKYFSLKMDVDPVSAVKEALNAKYVVSVGLNLTNSFMTGSSVSYGLWAPVAGEKNIGGHAMCVIGYDDTKYGGSFEILNSYGTNYGDGGFVWVKYSDFKKHMNQAFIIDLSGFKSTGCLYGDCSSFGIYRTTSGDIYEGYLTNGYPDVVGTFYYASGNFYVGAFKNGRRHGYGLFYNHAQAKYYNVAFSNDALVESSAIQGFANEADQKKPNDYYDHLKQFIPGELVTDEEEARQELIDIIEIPEQPLHIEITEDK